jgi:hypothetical protein
MLIIMDPFEEHRKRVSPFGGILTLLLIMASIHGVLSIDNSKEPPQKFEVVDTYKGCEVVRYTPPSSAHYHYFLDCTK